MKRSVFYLDDEVTALDLFQQMFGVEYDMRTVATLAEAHRLQAERPADIVISDQSMPDISGTDRYFASEQFWLRSSFRRRPCARPQMPL